MKDKLVSPQTLVNLVKNPMLVTNWSFPFRIKLRVEKSNMVNSSVIRQDDFY